MNKTKKCDCGCGNPVPSPPYRHGDKDYSSAYCLLYDIKACSYCGEKFESCRCNFSALDGE